MSSHAVPAHRASLALCAARTGHRDEALGEVRQLCADSFGAIPRDLFWLFAVTVLGEAIAMLGDRAHARDCYAVLSPYRGRYSTIGYGVALWSPVDRVLGLLAMLLGDYDQAEMHFRDALEMCEKVGARTFSVGTRVDWAELLDARGAPEDAPHKDQLVKEALREARELGLAYYERRLKQIINTSES